jgi:hypothetical protein
MEEGGTSPEPVMGEIGRGIALGQSGDRAAARTLFAHVWDRIAAGDALQRCALAHSMADVQDDPEDELVWDLRALEAAEEVGDAATAAAGMTGGARALLPSLHLNLADVYRRLGDTHRAAEHAARGLAAVDVLPDDGYGRMVREGLERIEARLAAGQD